MTDTVTQSDRERAASIAPPGLAPGILSGQMDGGKYVRAFTEHRNAALTLPTEDDIRAEWPEGAEECPYCGGPGYTL